MLMPISRANKQAKMRVYDHRQAVGRRVASPRRVPSGSNLAWPFFFVRAAEKNFAEATLFFKETASRTFEGPVSCPIAARAAAEIENQSTVPGARMRVENVAAFFACQAAQTSLAIPDLPPRASARGRCGCAETTRAAGAAMHLKRQATEFVKAQVKSEKCPNSGVFNHLAAHLKRNIRCRKLTVLGRPKHCPTRTRRP